MKKMKRRLLSLLMAAVMVCTLAPVGLATYGLNEYDNIEWYPLICADGQLYHTPKGYPAVSLPVAKGCITETTLTYYCAECEAVGNAIVTSGEHKLVYESNGDGTHTVTCGECNVYEKKTEACDTKGEGGTCSLCKADPSAPSESILKGIILSETSYAMAVGETMTLEVSPNPAGAALPVITWTSSNPGVASVAEGGKVTALSPGRTTIIADAGGKMTATCEVTVGNPLSIKVWYDNTSTSGAATFTSMNQDITFRAMLNNKEVSADEYDIQWTITGTDRAYFTGVGSVDQSYFTVEPYATSSTSKSCTVVVTVTNRDNPRESYTASYPLTLRISGGITLTATVSGDYYFSDLSNKGSYSVVEQLNNALYDIYRGTMALDYVVFDKVTSNYGDLENISANTKIYAQDFGSIKFVPTAKGDAVFTFTAYASPSRYYPDEVYSGVLTITVTDTLSGGDVFFYGNIGDDVYLDSSKFEDYWDSKFPGGTLDYVTFGSVSGGSLLDVDGKTAGTRSFYVSAGRTQYDLDDVHFRPNSANASQAVTVKFSFTAHGANRTSTNKTLTGTVNIIYMSKSPSDISYTVGSGGTVSLKASDFIAAYKEATGSNAPNNLTIVFQGVPSNGSLTYTDSSKRNSSAVSLTSSNIRSRQFTMSSSGTNQIGDVVYANSGSGTDTIEYTAYTGNTVKYRGRVVFSGRTVPTDITVTYQSVNGAVATFNWADFTSKSSALSDAETIRFGAPANGTLYLDGTAFAPAAKDLLVAQVNGVTYKPNTGSNAQEKLAFVVSDKAQKTVGSGTVIINVSGNTPAPSAPSTPAVPSTPSNSSGITSASQFTDVTANAWYFADLDTLVRKGIMSGRGNGIFDPNGTMTYGEALKLVLEATGHSAAVGTGNDWAINYKNLAVQNNWISDNISLTAPMPRLAAASLIARVLGLNSNTGDSPFADITDGYATALYHTNPQIFVGSTNPRGGKPLFNPVDSNGVPQTTVTRAQVCALICRLETYHQSQQAAQSSPSSNQSSQSNPGSATVTINPNTGLPNGV